jgi:hypothetical protein
LFKTTAQGIISNFIAILFGFYLVVIGCMAWAIVGYRKYFYLK